MPYSSAFIIADVPDNVSIAAASLVINAAGAVTVKTTVLLTPEEMDQAAKQYKHLAYRPAYYGLDPGFR